ncbi:nucleotide sugar dehydrogenase [Marinilongibacter aquaticus]|uniref:nucleotide sugar dehydrogenase n=1 Tax=Marinilongibacter aquaticus TaxID=2975157 RepID=UPI0021BD4FCF|nr:nucleotide sugar dehydrogenase [Marinilongibacter aquaticus]UBM57632.1 nucleotide sugar dehydrogenase [Marinilongibacter aquaticus]
MSLKIKGREIVVVGLGYVGLPVAMAFQEHFDVLGYDIDKERLKELRKGFDRTRAFGEVDIKKASRLSFCAEIHKRERERVFIVTVPTPIDQEQKPDLSHLSRACKEVASFLNKGDVVVFESTVYPGCTDDLCIPMIENHSGLKINQDFYCGYSPERISPGDTINNLSSVVKLTSGSNPEAANFTDALYKLIVKAGTCLVSSIKVAEAAKLAENCQRDVNISFVNELSIVFDKLGLNVSEVLKAAATKWNFLDFKPGLVGGHCISVDPYYLIHKAQSVGYAPKVIGAGREVNELMPSFVAAKCAKKLLKEGIELQGAKVLILGVSYKSNCPDLRNSKVPNLRQELLEFGVKVDVYDPLASKGEVIEQFGFKLEEEKSLSNYELVLLIVPHEEILKELTFFRSKGDIFMQWPE